MEKTARVLVTGGNGMVGRALVKRLRRDGYERILAPSSQELDLRNQAATHQFFTHNPVDFVFHLAGHIGGIGASVSYPVGPTTRSSSENFRWGGERTCGPGSRC